MSGDSLRSSSSIEITLNEKHDEMEHAAESTEGEEGSLHGASRMMHPRVGHQYQAIIPDLIEGTKCSQPNAEKVNEGITDWFLILHIPLMWAPNKARDTERLRGNVGPYADENQLVLNTGNCSMIFEQAEDAAENKVKDSKIRLEVDVMALDTNLREATQRKADNQEKNLYPLPGTPDEPWSDFERESFLLALYIFGKDLYLVKKFVETKKMEDVISFYYGLFYKCKEYQRWAKCLRSRSRKSIHGQRIFTRGRQQELFSRLSRHLSEESSNRLVEMSKTLKEEGMSFEEYVFELKNLIGTKLLIEVVAVGKGKKDLTGISTLPPMQKHTLSVRREAQQDKGLSSLSCKEITEQLMSSRLSKNKSNELFWEAVWPRLLSGGWHSEQPKDNGISTLKHHLVFLMPGITKFKRNKHVKGQHYFDSVSDVLNKVASDPRILELEDEKEENHFDGRVSDLPNRKHNGYEKSRDSNQQNFEMEFMIVDTSRHRGSNGSKVRWLESLPVHPTDISTSSACSGTGSDSSSEKSDVEGDETHTNISSQMANSISPFKIQEVDRISLKIMSSKKHGHRGKEKSGPSKYLSPLQRHQVNAADCEDSSEVRKKKKDKGLILCLPNPYKVKQNKQLINSSHMVVSESSQVSLPDLSPKVNEENESMVCESSKEIEKPLEQSLPHATMDLNVPQAQEDVATNHAVTYRPTYSSSITENTSPIVKHEDTSVSSSNTSSPRQKNQQIQQIGRSNIENKQPPRQPQTQQEHEGANNIGGRRQSTRNRPLTTKALEAFESSFFETNKKRKATTESTISKPPRPRRLGNSKSNSTSDSGIGSNDVPIIKIEDEHTTGNSGNVPAWLQLPPPQQVNLQLQLQ